MLHGRIRSVASAEDLAAFAAVVLEVKKVGSVDDFPNLLADAAGQKLTVYCRESAVTQLGLVPGMQLACRARLAARQRVFVDEESLRLKK